MIVTKVIPTGVWIMGGAILAIVIYFVVEAFVPVQQKPPVKQTPSNPLTPNNTAPQAPVSTPPFVTPNANTGDILDNSGNYTTPGTTAWSNILTSSPSAPAPASSSTMIDPITGLPIPLIPSNAGEEMEQAGQTANLDQFERQRIITNTY